MASVLVVGAGLAGLLCSWKLRELGFRVALVEQSSRAGGQLHTECDDGWVVEHGAEGFVAGSEAVLGVARELGLGPSVIDQREHDSFGFDGTRLAQLAPGEAGKFLGFQVPARAFGRGIQSFSGGMGQLVAALLERQPPDQLHLGVRVEALRVHDRRQVVAVMGGQERAFDRALIAVDVKATAGLVRSCARAEADALAQSEALSSVTVSLAYAEGQIAHPLRATGLVVAESAQHQGLRACTFVSSKFPGRHRSGHRLLRTFFRPSAEDLASLTDIEWGDRAEAGLKRVLPIEGASGRRWVSRWPSALPVFNESHRDRVKALERALVGTPVRLCGAAAHGAGIDGAVRSALATVRALAPRDM